MSNLNKSDIKKYEILNYMNYLLRNCATYSDQLNVKIHIYLYLIFERLL